MCLSCGCHEPENRHVDKLQGIPRDRITLSDMKAAAASDGLTLKKATENLVQTLRDEANVRI